MSPTGMPPPPDYSHHQQAEADHAQRIQDALLEAAKRDQQEQRARQEREELERARHEQERRGNQY